MLTGRLIDAQEAASIGLVIDVVPDDRLVERAFEVGALITGNSPMGIRMTKEVMWSSVEIPGQHAAIDLENRTQVMLTQTADHLEAVPAFRERRSPDFTDS